MKTFRVWLCTACAALLLFSFAISSYAAPGAGTSAVSDPFATIKEKVDANLSPWKEAYEVMLRDADQGLLVESHAKEIWEVPGFYSDKEGHVAGKISLELDTQSAYAGALAYRFTGDSRYANKAVELLNSWAAINKKIGEQDAPLASAYIGVGMINAANLLKDYPGWSEQEQTAFQNWVENVWMSVWTARIDRNDNNNWGDWMRYAMLAYYDYTDNAEGLSQQTEGLKHKIEEAINPDGFMPAENRGPNSFWYHFFALSPMTASADLIRKATGEDLFHWTSPSGGSLEVALENLFYYADGRIADWPQAYGGKQEYSKFLSSNYFPLNLFEVMADVYQNSDYERYVYPYRAIGGNVNGDTGYYHNQAWVYPTLLRTSFIEFPEPGYVRVEAENFTGKEKVDYRPTQDVDGEYDLFSTENTDYVWYNYLNFGSGTNYIDIRYATSESNGAISIRDGSLNGQELAYVQFPSTGGFDKYETIRVPITEVKGFKNIFLYFIKPDSKNVARINWFSYTTGAGTGTEQEYQDIKFEAEDFSGHRGISVADTDTGTEIVRKVGHTDNNDYVFYNNLDFGAGTASLTARYATPYTDSFIEIRDGSPTGTLLGSVNLPQTGEWTNYQTVEVAFMNEAGAPTEISGVKNMYIVFKRAGGAAVADFDWFSYRAKAANN